MDVFLILMFILLIWCLLSYLFNIRYIVISYIYRFWKEEKDNLFKKVKRSYKYIVIISVVIVVLLSFLNEKWGGNGGVFLIGLGYYFICYKVMFDKNKDDYVEVNFLKHMYKFHRFIDSGVISISVLFIFYSLFFIILTSVINIVLPLQIVLSIISGDIKGLLSYLQIFMFLNLFILPPILIKLFTWPKRKRDLSINITKALLTILYGAIVVYASIITMDMDDNMELIPIFIYMILLFSNILFIFVDIMDYYREKIKS